MRWCSRKTAGDISVISGAFVGAGNNPCVPTGGGEAVQAASARASMIAPACASASFALPVVAEWLTVLRP